MVRGNRLSRSSRRTGSLVAVGTYAIASGLFMGVPLLTAPPNSYLGNKQDATFAIWLFGWWPHAILHGLNPIVTRAAWFPDGVNLMWVNGLPALAVPFAPLTLLVGAFTSYDLVTIFVPAFIGWTGFILCRYLTSSFWPSFVGGFIFACSGFELGHTTASHIGLSAAGAIVALIALVVLRFMNGEISRRGVVARLGPLVAIQFLLSLEVLFTTALAIAVSLALYYAVARHRRRVIRASLLPIAGAYVLAGLLASPFVYFLLSAVQSGSVTPPDHYIADLTSYFLPSPFFLTGAGGTAGAIGRQFPSLVWQGEAYLGIPTLVIVGLFARERRRTASARFVLAALALGSIAAMGPYLTVLGHRVLTFPWGRIDRLPLYDNVLPVRLALFLDLLVAVVVAVWMAARTPGRLRWLLPLLAVVAIAPDPFRSLTAQYTMPAFFTDSAYRACLDPGATILPLPISGSGSSMLWQVADGFRFNMAGGSTGLYTPPGFVTPESVHYVTDGYHLGPYQALDVKAFVKRKHVDAVVVAGYEIDFFSGALNRLATPHSVGGVVLYNFEPAPPSCAAP